MPSPFPGMDPYLEHPALFPGLHNRLVAPSSASSLSATGNLDYHGGPVLHGSTPYLIFWDPHSELTSADKTLFERYFADAAADSGKPSNVFGVARLPYRGHLTDAVRIGSGDVVLLAAVRRHIVQLPRAVLSRCDQLPVAGANRAVVVVIEVEKLALDLSELERARLAAHLLDSLTGILSDEDEGVAQTAAAPGDSQTS